MWRGLALRREDPELFQRGSYTAVAAEGARSEHVVAFARRHGGRGLVAIATRLHVALADEPGRLPCGADVWEDTRIALPLVPDGTQLQDVLSGRTHAVQAGGLRLSDVLQDFPGALLRYAEGGG